MTARKIPQTLIVDDPVGTELVAKTGKKKERWETKCLDAVERSSVRSVRVSDTQLLGATSSFLSSISGSVLVTAIWSPSSRTTAQITLPPLAQGPLAQGEKVSDRQPAKGSPRHFSLRYCDRDYQVKGGGHGLLMNFWFAIFFRNCQHLVASVMQLDLPADDYHCVNGEFKRPGCFNHHRTRRPATTKAYEKQTNQLGSWQVGKASVTRTLQSRALNEKCLLAAERGRCREPTVLENDLW